MAKRIEINDLGEIDLFKEKIMNNTLLTTKKLVQTLMSVDGLEALKLLKFGKNGTDPLFEFEQNIIEQTNQTFTYLVCLDAVKILMYRHNGTKFTVNFGTQNGFDVTSTDEKIICECFASTRPDSNQKLEKDVKRVSLYEGADLRYVIYYSEEEKTSYVSRISNKYPNVTIIKLKSL